MPARRKRPRDPHSRFRDIVPTSGETSCLITYARLGGRLHLGMLGRLRRYAPRSKHPSAELFFRTAFQRIDDMFQRCGDIS